MNPVALRFLLIALAIAVAALIFAWFSKRERVQQVQESIAFLLKVSFFDFVRLIIFIKPWKQYAEQIGILVWLVLVFVTAKYLITTQPKINEISGPYIPMIGYIYYLSVLFIARFALAIPKVSDEKN